MSSIHGFHKQRHIFFTSFVLNPLTQPVIFKDGSHVEGLTSLSLIVIKLTKVVGGVVGAFKPGSYYFRKCEGKGQKME